VKQVGFKPIVKKRELWMYRVHDESEEEVTGEGIGESQTEELVPE